MQAVSKLRMSSQRLAIESGRWTGPARIPVDERKCTHCELLEDEYHFILECNIYAELHVRNKYIPKYFWRRPSLFKFIELMNTMKILRNLSIFIYHAFKCRAEQLYANR